MKNMISNSRSVARLRMPQRDLERENRIPIGGFPLHTDGAAGRPENQSLPAMYFSTLMRHRKLLIGLACGGALAGWLATLPMPAVYRARTSLDIQALNESFMNLRAVDPTDKLDNNAETFLQTEIKLLQSDTLLDRVVDKLRPSTMGSPLLKTVSRDSLLADLKHHITAKPIGMTRLVEINCDSSDPRLAAEFCNTLASEFVSQDLEVRFDSAQQTSAWLGKQLTEVREKLEQSEQKLTAFAQANSLPVEDEKGASVAQDRLRLLQGEITQAQADRVARESQYRMVNTSPSPDALPAVLDDEPSRQYQIKLAELRRQYAELSTTFTPDSSRAQKVDAQIKALEASMQKERENLVGRLKNEYDASLDREKKLTAAYHEQESLVNVQGSKMAQLNMLQREAESGRQLYTALLERVKEAGFASTMKSSPIRVVDKAVAPVTPIGPRRILTAGVGFLFGGVFAMGLAFFQDRTDRHVRRPGDAARVLSVREFGVIPSASVESRGRRRAAQKGQALELIVLNQKRSLMAEAYRSAMSSILFARSSEQRHSILVSSPTMGEGKTTLVSNLGIAMAETGRRVILVDGDLRMPRLHSIFDVGTNCGVKDFLRGDVNAATCPVDLLAQPTMEPNLFVLPAGVGPEDPGELLHSRNLGILLRRLEQEFDIVLIDSPPLLHLADARVIAQLSRGTVLVLRSGVATRDSALAALAVLEGDDAALLGIILNDFDPGQEALYNYYSDYYRYSGKATA
jgi:capsular exopolysaccharide synthesis family protein